MCYHSWVEWISKDQSESVWVSFSKTNPEGLQDISLLILFDGSSQRWSQHRCCQPRCPLESRKENLVLQTCEARMHQSLSVEVRARVFSCGTGTYCRVWKMVFNVFLLDVASFRFQLTFSDNERYAGNGLVDFELCMQQCSADAWLHICAYEEDRKARARAVVSF
jgi:hypothetical protein